MFLIFIRSCMSNVTNTNTFSSLVAFTSPLFQWLPTFRLEVIFFSKGYRIFGLKSFFSSVLHILFHHFGFHCCFSIEKSAVRLIATLDCELFFLRLIKSFYLLLCMCARTPQCQILFIFHNKDLFGSLIF